METDEQMTLPATLELCERLKQAYERVSPNLRALARRDFCEFHGVTEDTFRAKRTGQHGYVVTEGECLWMEDYKPQIVRS